MKAFIIEEPKPIEQSPLHLIECPIPQPKSSDLLIKVLACGVCRTDLHIAEGDIAQTPYPVIPGHQIVGVIEKMGSGCHQFKTGDLVGVAWLGHTCSQCQFCQTGKENLCPKSEYTGFHLQGGYAEYTIANENYVYPLKMDLPTAQITPLLCAGIIGYRAFKRSNIKPNQKIGLVGFGSSAHITMQVAQHYNCKVFVATRGEKHRKLAREMGAERVADSIKALDEHLDSIIIFAPSGDLVPEALQSLCSGGTCALAGITMSDVPKLAYEDCLFHEKNLCSVEANTRQDGKELLELAHQGKIHSHIEEFPFEKANEALVKLKQDEIKGSAVLVLS